MRLKQSAFAARARRSRHLPPSPAAAAGLLVLSACFSTAGAGTGRDGGVADALPGHDGGGGTVVVPGEVTLSVTTAHEQSEIDGVSATAGRFFAVFEAEVGNGLDEAIVANVAVFRARAGSLEVVPTALSSTLGGACAQAAFLAAQASLHCRFAVEVSDVPTALVLSTVTDAADPSQAQSVRVEAPVTSFERCERCVGRSDGLHCIDLSTSTDHCGTCGNAIGPELVCVDGESRCPQAGESQCYRSCVDLRSDPNNCGSCGTVLSGGQRCADGEPACVTAALIMCGGTCVDGRDPEHCGACATSCSGAFACTQGLGTTPVCYQEIEDSARRSCSAVCGAAGASCFEPPTSSYYYNEARYSDPEYDYAAIPIGCSQTPAATVALPDGQPHEFRMVVCQCRQT